MSYLPIEVFSTITIWEVPSPCCRTAYEHCPETTRGSAGRETYCGCPPGPDGTTAVRYLGAPYKEGKGEGRGRRGEERGGGGEGRVGGEGRGEGEEGGEKGERALCKYVFTTA